MNTQRLLFLFTTLLLITACTPPLQLQVDAITRQPLTEPAASYVLKSGMPGISEQDLYYLEFSRYAHRILQRQGFRQADDPQQANVTIFLSYGVGNPRTTRYLYSTPNYEYIGGETIARERTTVDSEGKRTVTTSQLYIPLSLRETSRDIHRGSYTRYTAHLLLEAHDNRQQATAQPSWRALVEAESASDDLRNLMPYMALALEPYLGRDSGEIVTLTLRQDDVRAQALKNEVLSPQPPQP